MSESYSDLQTIFLNRVSDRSFTCKEHKDNKTYDIDIKDVVMFYKNYCDTVFSKDYSSWNTEPILTISEKVEAYVPLIGEFVLKSLDDSEINESPYINSIIKIYHKLMKKNFEMKNEVYETICVYMNSDTWWKNGIAHKKVRIQFPFCRTKRDVINSVFNKDVINEFNKCSALKSISSVLNGGWEDTIKDISEYVDLYGSTEEPKSIPPLKFISVFGTEGENGLCSTLNLNDVFSYKKHSLFQHKEIESEEIDYIDDDCDLEDDLSFSIYTLPIFLSINFHHEKLRFIEHAPSETASVIIEEDEESGDIKNDLDLCNELLKHMAPKRLNTKIYFLDIGRAYYNATDGSYKGLDAWMKASEKSKMFDKEFCEEHYDSFENDKVTVKSMGWYFKSDNRKKYLNWHDNWCKFSFFDCLEADHTKVGEAFFRCFWLKYIYTGKRWLEFRRNRLVFIEEIKIKKTITNDFVPHFDILESALLSEKMKLNERKGGSRAIKHRMAEIDVSIERIVKLKKMLRNENYISSIIKSLRTFFYYEDITKTLNKNPSLLGCSNCVIELTDERAVKRDGKPEDFITKKLGVHYRSDYSYDHPDVQDLMKYLTQVFPVKEIRDLMTKAMASFMYGRNSEKICWVYIGNTNGSKSVFQKMIRTWMGDYYCDLPAEFFSGKKMNSSGPNPELAQTENARVAFTAEPDDDEAWSGAKIKKLTGGDSFYARSCNEDGGSIETTFKNIVVLNVIPDFKGLDEATKNRLFMVPFEGRWIKPDEKSFVVPETFEEQVKAKTYPMDPRFEDNLPRLAQALNWYCVNNYKKYLQEGLQKPKYIEEFINNYWKENDPYTSFIEENLEIPKKEDGTVDDNKYITATDLYPVYKKWFKSSYPGFTLVQKAKLITFLSTPDRLGKQRTRRWYGYTLRTPEENIEM